MRVARSKPCHQLLQEALLEEVRTESGPGQVHHLTHGRTAIAATQPRIEGHRVLTVLLGAADMTGEDLHTTTEHHPHHRVSDVRIGATVEIRVSTTFHYPLAMAAIHFHTLLDMDLMEVTDADLMEMTEEVRMEAIDAEVHNPSAMCTYQAIQMPMHHADHVSPMTRHVEVREIQAIQETVAIQTIAQSVVEGIETGIEIDKVKLGTSEGIGEMAGHAQGVPSVATGIAITGMMIFIGGDRDAKEQEAAIVDVIRYDSISRLDALGESLYIAEALDKAWTLMWLSGRSHSFPQSLSAGKQ
jgi:hypothetical protein